MKPVINKENDFYQPLKDKSKMVMTLSVFAFFIGFIIIFVLYPYTLIDFYTLSKVFIGFCVLGLIIPLRIYQQKFQLIKYEMILFNILGTGPFLTGLFLTLNFYIISNEQTINYEIVGYQLNGNSIDLELHSKIQHIDPKITNINESEWNDFYLAKSIDITTAEGLFGITVIKSREFKPAIS